MNYSIIVLSSVTYALKAQGALAREGINCRLEKLKKEKTLKGCGYGVRVEKRLLDVSTQILKSERIKVIDIIDYDGKI